MSLVTVFRLWVTGSVTPVTTGYSPYVADYELPDDRLRVTGDEVIWGQKSRIEVTGSGWMSSSSQPHFKTQKKVEFWFKPTSCWVVWKLLTCILEMSVVSLVGYLEQKAVCVLKEEDPLPAGLLPGTRKRGTAWNESHILLYMFQICGRGGGTETSSIRVTLFLASSYEESS